MTLTTKIGRKRLLLGLVGLVGLLASALLGSEEAFAQRTTATIQVDLSAGGAAPPAGIRVTALNTNSGVTVTATPRDDGSQLLTGLEPGEYLITAIPLRGNEVFRVVQVGVAQSVNLDLDIGEEKVQAAGGETIVVEGRVTEASTSEIATNVSREQIENLPQNNRNFLNFAQLAPGIRLNTDELRQDFSSGALGTREVNVFVDGVSLKSNVLQGGIVGQDASRGNPFPQLAVAGFRVITQNYKAEYEQAGSAIISSITRSGGNEYHGEIFANFQHESLTAKNHFDIENDVPKPDLARYQVGAAASGPVAKDKLFVFLTYEGNYQDRTNTVFLGSPTPETQDRFGQYEGNFTSPFREHLGFGKLTWRPVASQNVEVSGSLRNETDIRSFGDQRSFENAENVKNQVITSSAKHQWWVGSILNEGTFQFLRNRFNPVALNPELVGQEFHPGAPGSPLVIKLGSYPNDQNIGQRSFTFRDDVTFSDIEGLGQHVVKAGAKVSFQHYTVDKNLNGYPTFRYFDYDPDNDPATPNGLNLDAPAEASYGSGDSLVESDNTQFGLYVQDDWQIGRRLTLNVGVRWDIETNPLNDDHVTPDDVVAAVEELEVMVEPTNGPDFFRAEDFITDGNDRPIFLGAIQPRIGLAYDLLGDRNTILFGGAGRYYDRLLFNDGVDEKYRLQYAIRTFRFSPDGQPRDGLDTIMWNPDYLSRQGLDQLVESGQAPPPEIWLLENKTKPLHTDQLSGGVRQQIGPVNATATVTHVRSENGLAFYPVNRRATGTRDFFPTPGGFGNVIASADDRKSRYTSVQLQVDKPFDYELSDYGIKWSASLAYTLTWAKDNGGGFSFDYPTPADNPYRPSDSDERQRLVLTGIVGLPLDFRLSSLVVLGTGTPWTIVDQSAGTSADLIVVKPNGARNDKFLEYRQVDARLTKDFATFEGHRITAFVELFNIFNSKNLGGYDGFIPFQAENPNFGKPGRLAGPPRSAQLGIAYIF